MESKLWCSFVIALILTIHCNIYAIPLSEVLSEKASESSSSESHELSSDELSAENVTVNGTKKDL